MDRSAPHQLCAHLEDRLGDGLRSIVHYDAETQHVIYLRDDAQDKISSA